MSTNVISVFSVAMDASSVWYQLSAFQKLVEG